MANVDARYGLRPIKYRSGAPYNGSGNPYYIPSSYGTALFVGDPVVITGTANTAAVDAAGVGSYGPGELPEINRATAGTGNAITGVVVGFATNTANLTQNYNPASTERVALVEDNPEVVFLVQCDGSVAVTDIGTNTNVIYTHAGSTQYGWSGAEANSAAFATTAGHQLKVLRIHTRADNEQATANPELEVVINNSTFDSTVAGV